ncbi:MAG: 2-dehydropantoate 2-reductase N-terminal domain-containing protein, partial [Bdellovibrionales bacterium]
MEQKYQHIGVIGAGAWGTALAATLARGGRNVTLWSREPDVARQITERRENVTYLKGIELPLGIQAVSGLEELSRCEALVLATPAQHTEGIALQLADGRFLAVSCPVILAAKGI